jgi:hypothetical protein
MLSTRGEPKGVDGRMSSTLRMLRPLPWSRKSCENREKSCERGAREWERERGGRVGWCGVEEEDELVGVAEYSLEARERWPEEV